MATLPREYARAHAAVRHAKGKASEHDCVDCGGQALDWSQIHDTDDYEPRCRSCHKKYDMTDTIRETISKGANRGASNHKTKLTESDVLEIRERLKDGASQRELAYIFDVDKGTIANIVQGRTWRHI